MNVVRNPLTPVSTGTLIAITPIYLAPPSKVPYGYGGRNTRVSFGVQVSTVVPGVPVPSGTITVYLNGRAVGTYTLDAQGSAIVSLHGRTVYNKSLTIRYNGNIQGITNYAPTTSAPFIATKGYFFHHSPMRLSTSEAVVVKAKVHPAGPRKSFRVNHMVTMSVKTMALRHQSL